MINTVLLGHLTPVNKTILQFLDDEVIISVQHLPTEALEELRLLSDSDVLIVDIKSFSENPIQLIRYLKSLGKFKSIIAINTLSNWKLAELLLDAGADGYLTHETNEEEIIEAVTSINNGEPYVRF